MFRYNQIVVIISIILYSSIYNVFSQNETFVMTQIGSNNLLDVPFDLNYGPDNYLWVSEKNIAKIVRINPTTAERDELIQIPDAFSTGGQDGLLGFTFDPDFKNGSPFVYLSYTIGTNKLDLKQKIVRYTYSVTNNDGFLSAPVVLLQNLPAFNDHNSGRLIFGADSKLYYTIGDQANKDCSTNLAQILPTQQEVDVQNWNKYPGKILRINPDGSIPDDNPILNGVRSHIYSYGHRNPQGLVLGLNGFLYSIEHGPSSDDEINIINQGKNYGWPYIAGLRDNLQDGAICNASNETLFTAANYQDPIMSLFLPNSYRDPNCTDSWMCRLNIAPSSIAIYENSSISSWNKSLLLTSLKRGRVYRLKLNGDGLGVDEGSISQIFYTQNRYRDLVVSPDGKSIYIITDSSGKTSDESSMNVMNTVLNPGSILKFTLQESLSLKDESIDNNIKVWPNPTKSDLFISVGKEGVVDMNIKLYNSLGQQVKNVKNIHTGANKLKIDDLASGVYILKINYSTFSIKKRVVIE